MVCQGEDAGVGLRARDGPREVGVVGIAADVRATLSSRPGPEVYIPLAQAAQTASGSAIYVIGPAADTASLGRTIRQLVWEINAETPVADAARLDQLFQSRLLLPRFQSMLVSSFGAVALALAAAGVFSLVLYAVARRTRELAVRVALGATAQDLTRAIVPAVAAPVAVGLVVGLWVATRLAPLLGSMLFYEVSPTSPDIYAITAAIFAMAACAAMWLPLRRAWRLNPAELLRRE